MTASSANPLLQDDCPLTPANGGQVGQCSGGSRTLPNSCQTTTGWERSAVGRAAPLAFDPQDETAAAVSTDTSTLF
jgi:hypothetical protein